LLVVGVSTEDSHSETGKAVHDETAEATGSDQEERLLGVDVESPAAVMESHTRIAALAAVVATAHLAAAVTAGLSTGPP